MSSVYFTDFEFVNSFTAERLGIVNNLPSRLEFNRDITLGVLNQAREIYGKPIYITSGYRCPKLNAAVGGAPKSYHLQARAVDVVPSDGDLANLFDILNSLPHVEIILHNTYIHFAV